MILPDKDLYAVCYMCLYMLFNLRARVSRPNVILVVKVPEKFKEHPPACSIIPDRIAFVAFKVVIDTVSAMISSKFSVNTL